MSKKNKGKGWYGESRRHALARMGIKTVIDDDKRLDVSKYVAEGEERMDKERMDQEVKDTVVILLTSPEIRNNEKNEREYILDLLMGEFGHEGYDTDELKSLIDEAASERGIQLEGDWKSQEKNTKSKEKSSKKETPEEKTPKEETPKKKTLKEREEELVNYNWKRS